MRTITSADEGKELALLRPEPWMLKLLQLNPSYVSWGPGEDYMSKAVRPEHSNWASALSYESWEEHDVELDDLNECVHYYFAIERDLIPCDRCVRGYTPEAKAVERGRGLDRAIFLKDLAKRGDVESLLVLRANGRLRSDGGLLETALEAQGGEGIIDAIDLHVLLKYWCNKAGVESTCPNCEGRGELYTEAPAYVKLVYWLLHPRKGASRGVEVLNIREQDLPKVFAFLRHAAQRNAERFQKIVEVQL